MECKKIKFETEHEARDELFRIVEKTNYKLNSVKPARYYLCPYCNGYHLTHRLTITEY